MERKFGLTYTHTCGDLIEHGPATSTQEGTIYLYAHSLQGALKSALSQDLVPRCERCGALYTYVVPSQQK